ncbi:unnamed protein product [Rhizophagus irregularis]|uniref:Uncharacterized protein n=1 Tax=Rhizophagus irregularis TaxID=588596 RepID=A0A915Z3Q5_9GLOM|nr:unnamed protein product [Rhizophagus irregularis]CAB5361189.1 unnamed protein product [Rhizophagus irregularis]
MGFSASSTLNLETVGEFEFGSFEMVRDLIVVRSVSGNLEIRKTAVLWTSFARGILATGTLDLGFGDRFFGKFPSNPGRIQGHSHTRWILVTGRQFIFDGTHGFRISDLTVGRVTFDTGFLQATCSSDLFDPFFVRVVGFSVFLDADLDSNLLNLT